MNASPNFARVRMEVESALAQKAPSALSPRARAMRERMPSEEAVLDRLLEGGLPVGAITEFIGVTGSGRSTAAMAFAAAVAREARVAAWVDVGDTFDPTSAALNGVDLARLLWVRCAESSVALHSRMAVDAAASDATMTRTLHQVPLVSGGNGPHLRSEGLGMPEAIRSMMQAHGGLQDHQERRERKKIGTPGMPNRPLGRAADREEQVPTDRQPPRREKALRAEYAAGRRESRPDIQAMEAAQGGPRCAEPKPHRRLNPETAHVKAFAMEAAAHHAATARGAFAAMPHGSSEGTTGKRPKREWKTLDHALRVTDLLLQAGGFGLIVLDLGDTPAEMSWRIPLASWFRYRAACERSRTSLLLLTQYPCARSSAELVVRMQPRALEASGNVFAGLRFHAEVERQRFQQAQSMSESNVVAFRKPPQSAEAADLREAMGTWRGRAPWAV